MYEILSSIFREVVEEDFILHVDEKMKLYNPRGRDKDKMRMDIECEIHEFNMIKRGVWDAHEDWRIDAVSSFSGKVDIKFIKTWYNINCKKMLNIIEQRDCIDHYVFCQWLERPSTPLRKGDECSYQVLGVLTYNELLNNLQVSKYNGFYVDVRSLICVG